MKLSSFVVGGNRVTTTLQLQLITPTKQIISGRGWEMAGSRSVRRDVRSVGWRSGLRMLRR